jgi:hypothetical protein
MVRNALPSSNKARGLTVNQGHPRSVSPAGTHATKVAIKELRASYLQAFLDNLGGELIHAVVNCPEENVLGGTALVMRSAVLTDMLNAPISKLAMGEGVDVCDYLFDCRALHGQLARFHKFQITRGTPVPE